MNKHVEPPVRLGARAADPAVRRAPASARRDADPNSAAPNSADAKSAGPKVANPRFAERFRAAGRHSRRVRFFRWALPAGVLGALGITLAVNYLDPFSLAVDLPFELGRISLSGTQVKMEFPRLHGFTADNRGYSVTAEAAFQDLTKPDAIDLQTIDAKLELADKGWANLVAATGHYDTKTEQLKLDGGVRFDTSSGYGGLLQDAAIDIKGGKLVSKKPVVLTYLDGKLTADSIEVMQKDSRALLVGNVRLDFKMPPAEDAKPSDKPANAAPAAASAASPPASNLPDFTAGRVAPVPVTVSQGMPANVPLPTPRPPLLLRGTTTFGAAP